MTNTELDAAKAGRFSGELLNILNNASLALMISIGHRTGLFDVMAGLKPAGSPGIAAAAKLNERYVREWLGAMVAGRVVEYDAATKQYWLPAAHAACLTRAAAPNNLAAYAQYIPLLGSVEERILDCFREGGGIGYECFHRFHEVMAEDSGQTVLPALRESILPLVPGLIDRLRGGIQVLDVGCGRGRALQLMAREFPASQFLGADLSQEAVDYASAETAAAGLSNLRFRQKDLTEFVLEDRFDLITAFDAIHDQKDPAAVLRGIRHHLRPNGVFLMQDISAWRDLAKNAVHPLGIFIYTVSCMHCMTVSLAQGGAGLGAAWGRETAEEMLKEAGFSEVTVHELPHDAQNCYFVARP